MKRLAPLALAGLLTACAGTTATTVSQGLEKTDADAASAYAAVATLVNAAEVAHPAGMASDEALKAKAWSLFVAEHKAYKLGQSFDISGLLSLVATAKGL